MGLSSIFGGAPSLNTASTAPYTQGLNNLINNQTSLGKAAQGQYGQFNTQDVNAINNLSNYYTTNPATDQYNANATAQAAQAARVGSQGATAQLDQNLAARGISPNSSQGVGGLASIANQQASTNANIQAQQGANNEQLHAQNLAANANLWNDVTQQQFGNANTLNQEAADLNQQGFSDADQIAMQQYQVQQANNEANSALAGGLFSGAATLFGGGFPSVGGGNNGASSPTVTAPAPAPGQPWVPTVPQPPVTSPPSWYAGNTLPGS
jgi:hypothetical protein